MRYLASPRFRRRLLWIAAAAAAIAVVLVANAQLPSHGGPVRTQPAVRGPAIPSGGSSFAEQAAARRSAAEVQPLVNAFVDELANRHDLDKAYAMLAPKTRENYSLLDWRAGRDLPLRGVTASTAGASLAFAGKSTAGYVASFVGDALFAVRFDKLPVLGWRVAYMHQGHGSSHVTATSYSPSGFAPGSRHETLTTWLVLVGGLVALIGVVALVDRGLSRKTS
jgi:hypothetical protein